MSIPFNIQSASNAHEITPTNHQTDLKSDKNLIFQSFLKKKNFDNIYRSILTGKISQIFLMIYVILFSIKSFSLTNTSR